MVGWMVGWLVGWLNDLNGEDTNTKANWRVCQFYSTTTDQNIPSIKQKLKYKRERGKQKRDRETEREGGYPIDI